MFLNSVYVKFVYNNRGLVMTLKAEKYAFIPNIDGSSLTISVDGFCSGQKQCDIYFGFSIDDEQYFTFVTDLDGGMQINGRKGIFIYPECGGAIETGDPSELIPTDDFTHNTLAEALSGGDGDNFDRLTTSNNKENLPLTFELINNDLEGTFTFRFTSPAFSGDNALECEYDAVVTGKDLKVYISPDGGDEIINIESITICGFVLFHRFMTKMFVLFILKIPEIINIQRINGDYSTAYNSRTCHSKTNSIQSHTRSNTISIQCTKSNRNSLRSL